MVYSWIPLSIMTAICNAIIPTFTPVVNQYFYGSGIVSLYFIGTAVITFLGSMLMMFVNGTSFAFPTIPLLVSGILYGAGTLSLQKSVERAPNPASGTLLARNRGFLNAFLAYTVFGIMSNANTLDVYITQAILLVIWLYITKTPVTDSTTDYPWQMYSYMSMILLAISDVLLKNMVGFTNVLSGISWFSLAGALVPILANYRKTGGNLMKRREDTREDDQGVESLFIVLIGVFVLKIISQYSAIGLAKDSAHVRLFGSFAVPLTALFSYLFRGIEHSSSELIMYTLFTLIGSISGVRSLL